MYDVILVNQHTDEIHTAGKMTGQCNLHRNNVRHNFWVYTCRSEAEVENEIKKIFVKHDYDKNNLCDHCF